MRSGGNNEGPAGMKKGPWTPAEDAILVEYVRKHGEGNWNAVQKNSGLSRCGKSCRLRWANHLRPNLKKGAFSPDEELLILHLHAQFGNKWARMASYLPGRTDNEIKNYWNTRIKRRQRAGLPLYPPDMQRHHHHPSATKATHFSATSLSLLDPVGLPSHQYPLTRDNKSLGFQFNFPCSTPPLFHPPTPPPPPPPPQPQYTIQYNMGSFHFDPVGPTPFLKMELPSTQLFSEPVGSAGSGLLDSLLQENPEELADNHDLKWVHLVAGDGDKVGQNPDSEVQESTTKCETPDPSTGNKMKREGGDEMNVVGEDLNALFDMITTTATPATETMEWCNNESREMSNGPSSVVTEDDIGLEMQQLASSLMTGPEGEDWNRRSCSWSNMPRIC